MVPQAAPPPPPPPKVSHVRAFSDIMKRLNKNMHGDDPAFYRLPEDPKLAAQYLLLYEFSLPFGMDLNNRIDVAKSTTRMTVVIRSLSSKDQRDFDERAKAWLRANIPEFAAEASGITMVFAHLTLRNIHSMLRGTIIAMALISLISDPGLQKRAPRPHQPRAQLSSPPP